MGSTQESFSRPEVVEALFEKLEAYPWHSDEEFHSGLRSIVDAYPEQQENEALVLQARCFYYSRHVLQTGSASAALTMMH